MYLGKLNTQTSPVTISYTLQKVEDGSAPQLEKEGKVGLQLHGGSDGQMWFKNFQIMEITPEQRALIER